MSGNTLELIKNKIMFKHTCVCKYNITQSVPHSYTNNKTTNSINLVIIRLAKFA